MYTGQFYALFFLTQTLKVDGASANILIAIALLIGTPFFLFFGSLSDKIGRKPIILAGCLIAALTYFRCSGAHALREPAARGRDAEGADHGHRRSGRLLVPVQPGGHVEVHELVRRRQSALAKAGLNYENVAAPAGATAQIKVGDTVIPAYEGKAADAKAQGAAFDKTLASTLKSAGYPAKADPAQLNWPMTIVILTILVIYVTMVYGPIAAMLVEMFPTRIRYTSMSLPYHIGNGWFGGFLPATAFAIVAAKGNIYSGLWYPIVIALATFVIGLLFVKETKDSNIYAQD